MAGLGMGDLAQNLTLRRQNAQLKNELARLSTEQATGKVADLTRAVGGDHRASAALNRNLAGLAATKTATTEASLLTDTAQTAISTIQAGLTSRYAATISAGTSGNPVTIATTATEARNAFSAAVASLNVQVAGRPVLSGTGIAAPLPAAEDLLAAITTAAAGATTAAGVEAAVNAWFAISYDAAYQGATETLAPFQLGEGETATLAATAQDPAIRESLRGLALAALAGDSAISGNVEESGSLMRKAGEVMADAADRMTTLGAGIGVVQARIETAATRNAAETATLTIALSRLTEVDGYDTATFLTAVEGQQETLYAVTARLSALSLLDFLR